jgi:phosphopantothenoylcysteine decarboxylase/phosphopantothenate--cysteine ligase
MLKERRILIAMTGSIACYKACGVVSKLVQQGALVRVIMTRSATHFVAPLTLEALTGFPVAVEMFGDEESSGGTQHLHIDLSKFAEVVAVIPATANIVGKVAGGIADDLVSTTLLSSAGPILLAPAMNTHLYQNPVVQKNLENLKDLGYHIVEPDKGFLSCGEYGKGRLPDEERLIQEIIYVLRRRSGLEGKKVIVSAGRTEEPFDPVRFLTNRSSGKMGYAIARAARRFGAEVTLISGPSRLQRPGNTHFISVRTSSEMADAVMKETKRADLLVMAAAVSDFKPSSYSEDKIRREGKGLSISLETTKDILTSITKDMERKPLIVGFAMEITDLEENARRKLEEKGIDVIVGNNPFEPDTGFGSDFIRAVIFDKDGAKEELPILNKDVMSERLMEFIIKKLNG